MTLFITHTTRYRFDVPPSYGLQQLRTVPKSGRGQTVISWTTEVSGGRRELSYEDHHKNTVELVQIDGSSNEVVITSSGEVLVDQTDGVVGPHIGPSPIWLYRRATERTKLGKGSRGILDTVPDGPDLERLHGLSAAIRQAVSYETGVSAPGWSAEDAIESGRGVCQDHSHIFLACARELGFPARYVSGYLMLDAQTQQEAMHAWAEAYVGGLGWTGFDVSNGISPDERYVRVATGLDYGEAAPVSGLHMGGGGEELDVDIEVSQQ